MTSKDFTCNSFKLKDLASFLPNSLIPKDRDERKVPQQLFVGSRFSSSQV